MNLTLIHPKVIVIAVVVVLILVAAVALYMRQRKNTSAGLRARFGTEYERAVQQQGSQRKAEAKLADREARVEKLKIRDLDPTERDSYRAQWQTVQSRFVDDPKDAVTEADVLVCSLMQARGYPVSDFEQRAADISVDHPLVVENYRSAHNVALRLDSGEASTEELRTAMIQYRSLFDDLAPEQISGEIKVA
jgi:hypothetical protein